MLSIAYAKQPPQAHIRGTSSFWHKLGFHVPKPIRHCISLQIYNQ